MVAELLEGKRILLVDDDPDIVVAIKAALKDTGAAILTASDGDAAVDVALKELPDLVVLDAMLPKRSGFLVLEKLLGGKQKAQAPRVIMITGNQGKRHQAWAESLGVDDYINKPFRMERLIQSVEKLLSN